MGEDVVTMCKCSVDELVLVLPFDRVRRRVGGCSRQSGGNHRSQREQRCEEVHAGERKGDA